MSSTLVTTPWWIEGVRAQSRTIGALIMRELHTRFGRDNIGYLWLFVEPALLALGIAATRGLAHFGPLPWGMDSVSLYVSGYTAYMAFRSTVNRAGTTMQANATLLYHRNVTVVDLMLSRALLDTVAPLVAGLMIMALAAAMGYSQLPARPLLFLWAWLLNFWFCFGLGLLVLAGNMVMPTLDRFVHPATYLILPFSNVITIYEQLPPFARSFMEWIPTAQINEMVREGIYRDFNSTLTHQWYVIAWCMAVTVLGLLAVRTARSRAELE
jgi:capsular polysaccharide transport system permease protein